MKTLSALRTRTRGVAVLELAVLLVPLVIMTVGMTELGRAFYYYNGLVKSTRDATRYLSMYSAHEGEAQARCLAVYGQAACGDTPLVPGLERGMVHFTYRAGVETGKGAIDVVTVSLEGVPFTSYVPDFIESLVFGDISCTMRQGGS